MSYKDRLIDLSRDGEQSLTEQIAGAFRAAIDSGELAPGDRLPPTRELAELAGVNHLTAVRAYRRLRELGLVSSEVGRGTFVRQTAAAAPEEFAPGGTDWQAYALPELQESYGDRVIAEMFRLAGEGGAGVVPLSVGYPTRELYPAGEIQAALDQVLADDPGRVLDYADIAGAPELREQLTRLLSERAVGDGPDDLVITNGARQGLTLAARAILRAGDAVACEAPTFWGLLDSIRAVGARPLAVPVDGDGLDVDALELLIGRHDIKAVALQPRCHNPTGRDLSPARRERLVELARRHGFFVIEDGIYGELSLDGPPVSPLRAEAPEHVVYIDSLSKTLGGGLRIGWIAASGPVRDRILVEKQRDDIHSPTVSQLAAAEYLRSGDYARFLDEARSFYRDRRDVLIDALDSELGPLATLSEPRGGGHVWVTLEPLLDEADLTTQGVRSGVSFVPGAAMMPERPLRTMLRVSFCWLPPEDLVEGARRLGRAVRATMRRPQARSALPIA